MNYLTSILFFLTFFYSLSPSEAQSIEHTWKVIGYETGKERGLVQIYQSDSEYRGKVIKIIGADAQSICSMCQGERKDQPIVGMDVIWGLRKEANEYVGGTILDVENGQEYRCKLWIEGETLVIRGYYLFFYNTQKWVRND